jgi:hypothetical protein
VTSSNAYEEFLAVQEILDNDKAPVGGRICYCTPKYHNLIKLDPNFTKKGDLATEIAINGLVGMIDNVPVVKVPTSYFPAGVKAILLHRDALLGVRQITETRIITDSELVSGSVLVGRFIFGSFILDAKKNGVASIVDGGTASS